MQINKNEAGTIAAGIVIASTIIGTAKLVATGVAGWWAKRKFEKAMKAANK